MYIYTCECITGSGKFVQCSHSVRVFSVPVKVLSSKLSVSYIRYLQACSSLPTPQQTGIGERATTEVNTPVSEVNTPVSEVIGDSAHCNGRKRKHYTSFSDEDRAAIGRHAAENSNVSAL